MINNIVMKEYKTNNENKKDFKMAVRHKTFTQSM